MALADQDSPVTLVEGIGPAIVARLALMGVRHVFDLLRTSGPEIASVVAGRASPEEAARWRASAAFLQARGMTNQWAEALARAGFTSLAELDRADAARWRAAFDDAARAGRIDAGPDDAALAELRVEVARLAWSGALNVTVLDEADAPVAGARVRCGSVEARSNASGRARLARLPLGPGARLHVSKDGWAPRLVEVVAVLRDEYHLGVEVVRLAPAAASTAPARRLSQYDGDDLPEVALNATTTEARGEDRLRPGDVLVLRKAYDDGRTVQLTSKFLDHVDGRHVAISFRVDRGRLPADAAPGQHFVLRRGELRRIPMNATRLDLYKAMRRARALLRASPPPQTIAERCARMLEFAELVSAERRWSPGSGS